MQLMRFCREKHIKLIASLAEALCDFYWCLILATFHLSAIVESYTASPNGLVMSSTKLGIWLSWKLLTGWCYATIASDSLSEISSSHPSKLISTSSQAVVKVAKRRGRSPAQVETPWGFFGVFMGWFRIISEDFLFEFMLSISTKIWTIITHFKGPSRFSFRVNQSCWRFSWDGLCNRVSLWFRLEPMDSLCHVGSSSSSWHNSLNYALPAELAGSK